MYAIYLIFNPLAGQVDNGRENIPVQVAYTFTCLLLSRRTIGTGRRNGEREVDRR